MPRKSSIHFKPVTNVRFAVSHSERTDLSEPAYLLPKEHQLGNVVVAGSLSENELSSLFIQQKEGMSRQAKTAGASPFWEGVLVLSNTNSKEQCENLLDWKKAYEQATGHNVLHMSVHLDEGYVDATGHPQYNSHAHVIISRMDEKNKVIHLGRKQLATVQDLTASTLKMQRGSTLEERGGMRGRRHVGHREFRAQADENRLELDKEKRHLELYSKLLDSQNARSKDEQQQLKDAQLEASKVPQLQADLGALTQQIAQLKEQYKLDRDAMKATGEAKQADYQALKKTHEEFLATLKKPKKENKNDTRQHPKFAEEPTGIFEMQDVFGCDNVHDLQHFEDLLQQDAPGQLRPVQTPADHPELQQLDPPGPQLASLLADHQALKKAHEAALASLTTAKVQAAKVPGLEAQALQQASELARYRHDREALKASGEATQRDYQALKVKHEAALLDIQNSNGKLQKMDHYSEKLKTDLVESNRKIAEVLEAKAQAIEDLVKSGEKSEELLKTVKSYREDAAKIVKIAADFKAENVALKAEIVEVKARFETLAKTHQEEAAEAKEQASELRQLQAQFAGYREATVARAAAEVAASEAEPVPTIQQPLQDMAPEARKAAQDAPKHSQAPDPLPTPGKSLLERVEDWVKGLIEKFGKQPSKLIEGGIYHGKVIAVMDGAWAQKTNRDGTWVVHLGRAPQLDAQAEVNFNNGKSEVKGIESGKGGIGG